MLKTQIWVFEVFFDSPILLNAKIHKPKKKQMIDNVSLYNIEKNI